MKIYIRGSAVKQLPRMLSAFESSLGILGLALALWPCMVLVESAYAQWAGARELDAQGVQDSSKRAEAVVAAGARHLDRKNVLPPGTVLSHFEIPRLGMKWVLLEGTDAKTLDKSIGHVEGTAMPGERGNIAIAGHRNTHFRKLEWIRRGDEIILKNASGEYRYVVEWGKLFTPDDIEVLDAQHGPAVTLVTCFPFEYVGAAPLRYIVRALPK